MPRKISRMLALLCLALAGFAAGEKAAFFALELLISDTALMKVNNVELPLQNDGSAGLNGWGYYPAGSNITFLFQGGFAGSGYVNGELRCSWMAKSSLVQEWQPGKWGMNPQDPLAKFYSVTIHDGPGSPAYLEWADAVALGAEFIDRSGDGVYDPFIDRPALMGDKTIWTVFNDGVERTSPRFGTPPLGLEIQQTAWAYDQGGSHPLDEVIFFRWKIINADSGNVDSLIHSFWADPDLGSANDDLIGCDTLLNIGYVYNDGDDPWYGANPPAFGAKLLQGAMADSPGDTAYVFRGVFQGIDTLLDKKNLPWTSFMYYIGGDPVLHEPTNAPQARYYQIGGLSAWGSPIDPTQWGVGGTAQTNPKYFYSGDPVTTTGWRDNIAFDKRFLVNCGPFNLALGDTQDIVLAYVIGRGSDALNSITVMREHAAYLGEFFPLGRALHLAANEILLPIDSLFIFEAILQTLAYPESIVSLAWQLIQRPPGSAAQLMPGPGFQQFLDPDLPGDYLVKAEAVISSGETLVTTRAVSAVDNRPPAAHLTLTPSQIIYGASILADASASSDPDGDPLNFEWTFPFWANADTQNTSMIEFSPVHTGSGKAQVAVSDPYFTRTAEDSFTVVPNVLNLIQQLYLPQFNEIHQLKYVDDKIFALSYSYITHSPFYIFDAGANPTTFYSTSVVGARFVTDGSILAGYGNRTSIALYRILPDFTLMFASDTIFYGSQSASRARDIYLQFPYLFVPLRSPSQLHVYDVSDPFSPVEIAFHAIPHIAVDAAYQGNIAAIYFQPVNTGLRTYEISDPLNIVPLDTLIFFPAGIRVIEMGGGKIYVSNGDMRIATQVQIVDASQPNNLQLAGTITVAPDVIVEMEAHGDLLILGLENGVRLYDVSNPNAPQEIAHRFSGFPVYGMAWNDPQFYMVENGDAQFGGGYYYFDHVVGLEPGGDLSAVPGQFELLQNYPNPFNPATTIRYRLPVTAKVELLVYNMLGQKIRRLVEAQQAPGSYQVQWDGRSDGGNALASGIYFYRLKVGEQGGKKFEAVKKMLLLK